MKKLSPEGFARARDFLKADARSLERALFEYRFEDGPVEAILTALGLFQNRDGGFGRALEPDVRVPASSALATGMALSLLEILAVPAANSLVSGAVGYLLETLDSEAQVWRAVPPEANDAPHAPWWHDEGGSLARTFGDFQVIPRAEIVGVLHHFGELVDGPWLAALTEETVSAIEALDAGQFGGGGDTLVYALNLAETEALPEIFRARLLPRLRAVAQQVVSQDPAEWDSYVAPPLKIAPLPTSPVADLFEEAIDAHLDYLIDTQTAGGFWNPAWSWGDAYPQVWAQARQEWRGILTLDALSSLRAYGRLAT